MSEELSDAVSHLRAASARLNQITDRAAVIIRETEDFLNKECSIGINASVVVSDLCDQTGEVVASTDLVYERVGSRFRIAVVSGFIGDEDVVAKPWAECSRDQKLESIAKLPELILAVSRALEAKLDQAENATATALSILESLRGNGA